jgi:hypothetical protein
MIDFLLASAIASSAPRTFSPVRSAPVLNPVPAASPTSNPPSALPAVPVVYPNRNTPVLSPSTTQPSNKSWSDKVWERYKERQQRITLPNN